MTTLGQIAYEAAAATTGCQQAWADATQAKWEAAARAVTEELAMMCEAKAKKLGRRADRCEDDEGAIELKARSWQMVVTAVELRDRSNKGLRGATDDRCKERR